ARLRQPFPGWLGTCPLLANATPNLERTDPRAPTDVAGAAKPDHGHLAERLAHRRPRSTLAHGHADQPGGAWPAGDAPVRWRPVRAFGARDALLVRHAAGAVSGVSGRQPARRLDAGLRGP